jgi:outer membrane protein TolC
VQELSNLASVGMASQADLLAAQARQSQTRLDALRAAHGSELAEMVFKVTLGLPADEPLDLLVDDLPPVGDLPRDAAALRDLAISRRPDLAALDRSLDAMEHYARASRASWLPSLVLQGDLGWKNPDYSLEPNWYRTSDLVLAASWSLWDRGQALTRTRAMRASRAQLAAQRSLLADMLGVEIRSALSTFDEAAVEVEVATAGLAQASESLRMEQERFQQGMANNTQILAAQAALAGARLARLQAETKLRTSHAALRKAAGVDPGVNP